MEMGGGQSVTDGMIPKLISQTTVTDSIFSHRRKTPEQLKQLFSDSETRLVLHFDINETILIGDEAGGDSVHDCLNKVRTSHLHSYPSSILASGLM